MSRNRHPKGVPIGGQFAPGSKAESNVPLALPDTLDDDIADCIRVDAEGLWAYVRHPDPKVQSAAVHNHHITAEQLDDLQRHDRHLMVRQGVVYTLAYGRWRLASTDPSPMVRAKAVDLHDIPPDVKSRLLADPDVVAHRRVMPSTKVFAHDNG